MHCVARLFPNDVVMLWGGPHVQYDNSHCGNVATYIDIGQALYLRAILQHDL